ncbi:MAG: glycerate kinase [Eubacterium sp.]|nr:glycerate kinase [Eubacterium sp.]
MKIVIAPDSFKGSLSAQEVCRIVGEAAAQALPEAKLVQLPVSDGGEGMVDSLLGVMDGERHRLEVTGPCFDRVVAEYGVLKDGTAVLEMASASGLPLVPENQRNPLETTTLGTGELMMDAFLRGCRRFILGLGGSATTDGGIGAAAALGMIFLDKDGKAVPLSGKGLEAIVQVDTSQVDPAWSEAQIVFACDVDNPLCGKRGSAAVYGPQKGADAAMVKRLDAGLANLEGCIRQKTGQAYADISGIGAAGGFALPFVAFLGAQLNSGLDIVLDELKFDEAIAGADLIITGEGKTDEQSAMGKVLSGVARRARAQGIPVAAISGALEPGYEALYALGMTAAFSTWQAGKDLDWQMAHAAENLGRTARDILRLAAAFGGGGRR